MTDNENIHCLIPLAEDVPDDWIYPLVDDSDSELPCSSPAKTDKSKKPRSNKKVHKTKTTNLRREVPIITLPDIVPQQGPTYAQILKSAVHKVTMNTPE